VECHRYIDQSARLELCESNPVIRKDTIWHRKDITTALSYVKAMNMASPIDERLIWSAILMKNGFLQATTKPSVEGP
jgi:hypothetical protein